MLEFPGSVGGPWARYIDATAFGEHPRNLRFQSDEKSEAQIPQINAEQRIGTVRYPRLVPRDAFSEGSYGADSFLVQRPRGTTACLAPQELSVCP